MPRIRTPRWPGDLDTIYLDDATEITISGQLPWWDGKGFEIVDNKGLASMTRPVTIHAPVNGGTGITIQVPYGVVRLRWGVNGFYMP